LSFGIVSASSQKGRRPGGRNDAERKTILHKRERSELPAVMLQAQ